MKGSVDRRRVTALYRNVAQDAWVRTHLTLVAERPNEAHLFGDRSDVGMVSDLRYVLPNIEGIRDHGTRHEHLLSEDGIPCRIHHRGEGTESTATCRVDLDVTTAFDCKCVVAGEATLAGHDGRLVGFEVRGSVVSTRAKPKPCLAFVMDGASNEYV